MANVERTATTVWEGDLAHGNGVLSLKSGAAARPARHLGVAHRALGRQDEPRGAHRRRARVVLLDGALARAHRGRQPARAPRRLRHRHAVDGRRPEGVELAPHGARRRPGPRRRRLRAGRQGAADGCPISGALKGNLEISVDAQLGRRIALRAAARSPRRVVAELQDGQERLLGHLDAPDLLHAPLALLLLLEQLALARDVAAVALGDDVLAEGLDRLAGDDVRADAAWIGTSYCWRGIFARSFSASMRPSRRPCRGGRASRARRRCRRRAARRA